MSDRVLPQVPGVGLVLTCCIAKEDANASAGITDIACLLLQPYPVAKSAATLPCSTQQVTCWQVLA